ncbi:MAG TPA: SpaA isopeptide-forming pilin-related protein [Candidatus Limnocylindrales bacterium]
MLFFVLSIGLQYAGAFAPVSALAANASGNQNMGGFEIDGDFPAHSMAPQGDDWANAANTGAGVVSGPTVKDPFGTADTTVLSNGVSDGDPLTDWQMNTNAGAPQKADIGDVYAIARPWAQPPTPSSHFWAYIGIERKANTGTVQYDLEFNQLGNRTNGHGVLVPNRTTGDLLFTGTQQGGGSWVINGTVQTWTGSWDTGSWSSPQSVGSSVFYGLVNDKDVTHPSSWPDALGATVPQNQFAEIAIDVTMAVPNAVGCPGYGELNVRSISSTGTTPELKDVVAPIPLAISTCGSLSWQKQDGNGAALGGATFSVTPNPLTGSGSLSVVDNTGQAGYSGADSDARAGFFKLAQVKPGTYTVQETAAPTGYVMDTHAYQVTVGEYQDATLSQAFVDPRKTATTTLVAKSATPADASDVSVGQQITLAVTETNTGQMILHSVNVTGTNSCANWTAAANKNGGGAFSGTLNPGESVDFSCQFNAPDVASISWSATGHGLDELGAAASLTNETVNGSYTVIHPSTLLSVKSAPPAKVHAGDSVSIVVTEANDGDTALTGVHVNGSGSCASWTAAAKTKNGATFSGTLAAADAVDFSCTFTAGSTSFAWSASGYGTDSLGHAVPTGLGTPEYVSGNITVIHPATTLVTKSATATAHAGDPITIVVTETNSGDDTLSDVHISGTGCTSYSPANVATLAPTISQDFTCTMTAPSSDLAWTADALATDSLGAAAPSAGEHTAGTVTIIHPATTLVTKSATATAHAGDPITIVVTETNSGDDALSDVHISGSGCTSYSPANVATLPVGDSIDFTCTMTAPSSDLAWTADALATDSLGAAAPSAGEHTAGTVTIIHPATALTTKVGTPTQALQNTNVTLTVTEANTGDDALTGVSVSGTGCTTWAAAATTSKGAAFSGSLAAGDSIDFSCTMNVGTSSFSWSASGHGTDSLGRAVATGVETPEYTAGSVHVVNPNIDVVKTAGASLASQAADGTVYTTLEGSTVVYKYVVTTLDPDGLTAVSVSDDVCSPVTAVTSGGFNVGDTNSNGRLEPGESWVFQCSKALTFADANSEDPHGVHNVATASGQPIEGGRVSANDVADVHLYHPAVTIAKSDDDADKVVTAGQTVTFTLTTVVSDGPSAVTVSDVLPAGQTYVAGSQSSSPVADSFSFDAGTRTLSWTYASLNGTATQSYKVTIDAAAAGNLTNTAKACVPAFNEFAQQCDQANDTLRVPGLALTKAVAVVNPSLGPIGGIPQATVGETLTYTVTYTVSNGPLTNAVLTDVLPTGLTSASNAPFSISNGGTYDAGSNSITWHLGTLATGSGSVTYQVKVTASAVAAAQPLLNTATITTAEIGPISATARVLAQAVQAATGTPKVTPPPTSTPDNRTSNGGGLNLALVLLALAGIMTTVGLLTPAPSRARRRDRRG